MNAVPRPAILAEQIKQLGSLYSRLDADLAASANRYGGNLYKNIKSTGETPDIGRWLSDPTFAREAVRISRARSALIGNDGQAKKLNAAGEDDPTQGRPVNQAAEYIGFLLWLCITQVPSNVAMSAVPGRR